MKTPESDNQTSEAQNIIRRRDFCFKLPILVPAFAAALKSIALAESTPNKDSNEKEGLNLANYKIDTADDYTAMIKKEFQKLRGGGRQAFDINKIQEELTNASDPEKVFSLMKKFNFMLHQNHLYPCTWFRLNGTLTCLIANEKDFFQGYTSVGQFSENWTALNIASSDYNRENCLAFLQNMRVNCKWVKVPPPEVVSYLAWLHENEHIKGERSEITPEIKSITEAKFKADLSNEQKNGLYTIKFFPDYLAVLAAKYRMTDDAHKKHFESLYGPEGAKAYEDQLAWFESAFLRSYPAVSILKDAKVSDIEKVYLIGEVVFGSTEERFKDFIEYLIKSGANTSTMTKIAN